MKGHNAQRKQTTKTTENTMATLQDHEEIRDIVFSASGPIHLADLASQLGYGSSRAVAKRVSAAWNYYNSHGDYDVCEAISHTFIDANGNYPWA